MKILCLRNVPEDVVRRLQLLAERDGTSVDSEVASGVRRHVASGRISAIDGWTALDTWRHLGLTRYATNGLLRRIGALRDNLCAYDAGYVALAESLDCTLVTADARISRAPGIRCPITVVPK